MEKVKTADRFKKILVGVDDTEDAQLAFHYAMDYAKNMHAALYIVTVLEDGELNIYDAMSKEYLVEKRKDVQEKIQTYVEIAKNFGVPDVQGIFAEGDAGEAIVKDVIPKVNPDLLIVGSLQKNGLQKYFGSQAAYMAKYAPISVLVVR